MINSQRFKKLQQRLTNIEKLYIPSTKANGNYTNIEKDNIRAYLLLAHAEMESYFEEIAEEKAKKVFKDWKNNHKKSNVLLALASFSDFKNDENDLQERLNKSLTDYIRKLKDNNGIKEKNILAILLPIGVKREFIDNTWLNTLNSFGTIRGNIAHSAAHVQQSPDPVTIKNEVTLIFDGIKDIDKRIYSLK